MADGHSRRFPVGLTLVSTAAFAVLVGLGLWQVHRLHWKQALIAERQAALAAPPVDLAGADSAGLPDLHPVTVTGRFEHEHEMFLLGRSYHDESGYGLIVPLALADGRTVLVDRGFLPLDRRDPATRRAGQIQGLVTVRGLARRPKPPGPFTPANEPGRNIWFSMDIPAMAAIMGIDKALPVYVAADKTPNPGGYPVGGQSNPDLPNNHLGYALTWFGLAASLAVIYGILLRGRLYGPRA